MASITAAVSKGEAKLLAMDLQDILKGKSNHVHVGTWMDRPGVSIEIRLTSKPLGRRIVIHKWADEVLCNVRLVEGDAWRDPDHFVEHGSVEEVDFASYNIGLVAHRDLGVAR